VPHGANCAWKAHSPEKRKKKKRAKDHRGKVGTGTPRGGGSASRGKERIEADGGLEENGALTKTLRGKGLNEGGSR